MCSCASPLSAASAAVITFITPVAATCKRILTASSGLSCALQHLAIVNRSSARSRLTCRGAVSEWPTIHSGLRLRERFGGGKGCSRQILQKFLLTARCRGYLSGLIVAQSPGGIEGCGAQ